MCTTRASERALSELRTQKCISAIECFTVISSLVRKLPVSMLSMRQVAGGTLVAVPEVKSLLP